MRRGYSLRLIVPMTLKRPFPASAPLQKESPGEPFEQPPLPTLATLMEDAGYKTPRGAWALVAGAGGAGDGGTI